MRVKLFGRYFGIHKVWLLITVTAFIILSKLGYWQLQRAEEKAMQLSQLQQLQQQGALNWQQLAVLTAAEADGVLFAGDGQWLQPYVWLLDNQIVEGKVGYDVIIPVQSMEKSRPLLVNLGWVPAGDNRAVLPELVIPEQLQLQGLIRSKVGGFRLGPNTEGTGWPQRIQQPELEQMANQLPVGAYAFLLYQQGASPFLPHYQAVVMPPEKHHGYAFQWFMLAIAVVAVALAAARRSGRENE
ncbi:SURF1 family protein [Arsukibacterium indicum]|uniref:SURF1-like protein n=1 Tax=Arsukibacterium indicum TaxID=2848612 RepID=A0ABS6MQQ4_9GAMM|nr:SURF1 family protein [Arsukibacterium indicum]MBV2130905.1 SURF1 family protein [Arsukibacterium indicum]